MEKLFAVYMLASRPNGTLYLGVTSNLPKRVWEHRNGLVEGFTKMKKWNRLWKLSLVNRTNPEWRDLFPDICR